MRRPRPAWGSIVSARSGETEDSTIVHLAVGWGAPQLKVGSFTPDRNAWSNGTRASGSPIHCADRDGPLMHPDPPSPGGNPLKFGMKAHRHVLLAILGGRDIWGVAFVATEFALQSFHTRAVDRALPLHPCRPAGVLFSESPNIPWTAADRARPVPVRRSVHVSVLFLQGGDAAGAGQRWRHTRRPCSPSSSPRVVLREIPTDRARFPPSPSPSSDSGWCSSVSTVN